MAKKPDNWRDLIAAWEAKYLDESGRYVGYDESRFGFSYKPGEFVPINKRYSAMNEHAWAISCYLATVRC